MFILKSLSCWFQSSSEQPIDEDITHAIVGGQNQTLLQLPVDILWIVIRALFDDPPSICKLHRVCKYFNNLLKKYQDTIWKDIRCCNSQRDKQYAEYHTDIHNF